jgi:hypothetical protein
LRAGMHGKSRKARGTIGHTWFLSALFCRCRLSC